MAVEQSVVPDLRLWRDYARVLMQCYAFAGLIGARTRRLVFANTELDDRSLASTRVFGLNAATGPTSAGNISTQTLEFREIQSALRVLYNYVVRKNYIFNMTLDAAAAQAGSYDALDARAAEIAVLLVLAHEMHIQTPDATEATFADALRAAYERNTMGPTLKRARETSVRPAKPDKAAEPVDVSVVLGHLATVSLRDAHDTTTPFNPGFMDVIGIFTAEAAAAVPTLPAAALTMCALLLMANRAPRLFPRQIAAGEFGDMIYIQKVAYLMYSSSDTSVSQYQLQFNNYHERKTAGDDTALTAELANDVAVNATNALWDEVLVLVRATGGALELDGAVAVLKRIGDVAEERVRLGYVAPSTTPACPAYAFLLAAEVMLYRPRYDAGPADAPDAPPSRLLELAARHTPVLVQTLAALVWLYADIWGLSKQASASAADERAQLRLSVANVLQPLSAADAARARPLGRAASTLLYLQQQGVRECIASVRNEFTRTPPRPHSVGAAVLDLLVQLTEAGYTPAHAIAALYQVVCYLSEMAQLKQDRERVMNFNDSSIAKAWERISGTMAALVGALVDVQSELDAREREGLIPSPDYVLASASATALASLSAETRAFVAAAAAGFSEDADMLADMRALALALGDEIRSAKALAENSLDVRVSPALQVPINDARASVQLLVDFVDELGRATS